jgi:carboxypeptidase Q
MTTSFLLNPVNRLLKIIQVFMFFTLFGVFIEKNSLFASHSKNAMFEFSKNDLKINSIREISIQNKGNFSKVDSLKPMEIWFEQIHQEALLRGHSYSRLGELCKKYGARLSGSDQTERAILWASSMLKSYEFDSVYQQPVMVPRWERGSNSSLAIHSPLLSRILSKSKVISMGSQQFGIVDSVDYLRLQEMINQHRFNHSPVAQYECNGYINWLLNNGLTNKKELKKAIKQSIFPGIISALGGSVSGKIDGKIVCIQSKSQLDSLGKTGFLNGKIVLLNRPFEEDYIQTFKSYGSCVNQRVNGADWCAPYGVKGVLVRSMSNSCDMHAHTGVTYYSKPENAIPIAAIPTALADALNFLNEIDSDLKLSFQLDCKTGDDRLSSNVIAETKGLISPNKVIVFGGHFDSWDEGEGAHDDGAGCMHAFEALRILKTIGYQPKHTLRCAFWINEENGLKGALKYAELVKQMGEIHIAAIESDRGGFAPRGFGVDSSMFSSTQKYRTLWDKYMLDHWEVGGGGADIGPLKKLDSKTVLVSFIPDSQRYFDVHHAKTDVFENVNKRELELGAAAMACMIIVLDQEMD